jgi:hypothetical protein
MNKHPRKWRIQNGFAQKSRSLSARKWREGGNINLG